MDRPSFAECIERHPQITAEKFDRLIGIHMEQPEKVTGAFELDFDKQEFSAVHPTEGWQTFPMKEVSAAAYRAFRPDSIGWPERTRRFTGQLAGREIASAEHLSARQITFADEISEIEGKLNFYIDTGIDVDAAFGTQVCTDRNDDCLNVYADELRQDAGRVTAALDIDLDRGTFSTLAGGEGWQTYTVHDVCVAAWQATIYCAATFLRNSSFVVVSQTNIIRTFFR